MPDHKDHRELGYGNADARPDIDGTPGAGGGQSEGEERHEAADTNDGKGVTGGQTDAGYSGGDNPNATRDGDT